MFLLDHSGIPIGIREYSYGILTLIIPVEPLLVAVEIHLLSNSGLSQGAEYELLLLRWDAINTPATLKVAAAREPAHADGHERLLLLREHALLKLRKASGIHHGLVFAVVGAGLAFGTLVGIDETQNRFRLPQRLKSDMPQARGCQGAVSMHADIVEWG